MPTEKHDENTNTYYASNVHTADQSIQGYSHLSIARSTDRNTGNYVGKTQNSSGHRNHTDSLEHER